MAKLEVKIVLAVSLRGGASFRPGGICLSHHSAAQDAKQYIYKEVHLTPTRYEHFPSPFNLAVHRP